VLREVNKARPDRTRILPQPVRFWKRIVRLHGKKPEDGCSRQAHAGRRGREGSLSLSPTAGFGLDQGGICKKILLARVLTLPACFLAAVLFWLGRWIVGLGSLVPVR
jgi:hypothetical protein